MDTNDELNIPANDAEGSPAATPEPMPTPVPAATVPIECHLFLTCTNQSTMRCEMPVALGQTMTEVSGLDRAWRS